MFHEASPVGHACNPSTCAVETGRTGVQDILSYSKFEASLNWPCLNPSLTSKYCYLSCQLKLYRKLVSEFWLGISEMALKAFLPSCTIYAKQHFQHLELKKPKHPSALKGIVDTLSLCVLQNQIPRWDLFLYGKASKYILLVCKFAFSSDKW